MFVGEGSENENRYTRTRRASHAQGSFPLSKRIQLQKMSGNFDSNKATCIRKPKKKNEKPNKNCLNLSHFEAFVSKKDSVCQSLESLEAIDPGFTFVRRSLALYSILVLGPAKHVPEREGASLTMALTC